jgi:hypothetical protein
MAQYTDSGTAPVTETQVQQLLDAGCVQSQSKPVEGIPILEFVIDISGSMSSDSSDPTNSAAPKKWTVLAQSMPTVIAALPSNFAVGVSFYNLSSGCFKGNQAVPILPLDATQATAINSAVTRAKPGGRTPTYSAWKFGLDTVAAWQGGADYTNSPRYVVLITDGVPTVNSDGCTVSASGSYITQDEYDAELQLIQSEGAAAGVQTFVVGVVGSDNPQGASFDPLYMLSQIAVVGGTAPAGCVPAPGTLVGTPSTNVDPRGAYCHFDLSQQTDLGGALATTLGMIVNQIPCVYAVPTQSGGVPVDPSTTILMVDDGSGNWSQILQNTSSTCDKGWHFTDATNTSLEICGSTCTAIQNNRAANLQLVFGCKEIPHIG